MLQIEKSVGSNEEITVKLWEIDSSEGETSDIIENILVNSV